MANANVTLDLKVCVRWVHLKPDVSVAIGDVVTEAMIERRWWIIAWYWARGLARAAWARLAWWRRR